MESLKLSSVFKLTWKTPQRRWCGCSSLKDKVKKRGENTPTKLERHMWIKISKERGRTVRKFIVSVKGLKPKTRRLHKV